MDLTNRAIIQVKGRVQGVGYRYAALLMARKLNLTGYVKNLPDESVYIEAQGRTDALESLIEWCKTGPAHAIVESVEHSFHPAKEFADFKVRG